MISKFFSEEVLKYVSNLDKDVYSVKNLPEEVIAVIFAYVSRSPKSFRENILKVTEDKASKFHEKWVLNFGHSSVAELATAHICIENVSRLFSSILERANLFISPIEYSQRYQKPKRGAFYIPPEFDQYPELKQEYIDYNFYAYDMYDELYMKLLNHHKEKNPKKPGEKDKKYNEKWEKVAFEDARYLLPLSVYTNLGITANGRAMEDLIGALLADKHLEVMKKAQEIKREAKNVLPTLVKYADENEYIKSFYNNKIYDCPVQYILLDTNPDVRLMKVSDREERKAVVSVIAPVIAIQNGCDQLYAENHLQNLDDDEILKIYEKCFEDFGTHDQLWKTFHEVKYTFELTISEACWHQLLRHRMIDFYELDPDVNNGVRIPPFVKESGYEDILADLEKKSSQMFKKISNISEDISNCASYVVLNAHKRRITATIDLWALYHLINLRLSEHAQWDIKDIVTKMCDEVANIHPNIIKPALDRVLLKNGQ